MGTSQTLAEIRARIVARYGLLWLVTWEEDRWEDALGGIVLDMQQGLVSWTATRGFQPARETGQGAVCQPREVLAEILAYPPEHVFVLRDFHPYLDDPGVVRAVRDLVPRLSEQKKTVLFLSPRDTVPVELERDVLTIPLPLPELEDLRSVLVEVLRQHYRETGQKLQTTEELAERVLKSVVGLTESEARRALTKAVQACRRVDEDLLAALVQEKKTLLRGSELLEFYDLDAGINDIGGLDALKDWLQTRASAYSEKARKAGLPMPRGALLLGVQGCGKSLTARAAARLLCFPLVRLDVAGLLSSDRGSSERNMRDALRTVETVAPAVLWLDEVEKAFSGVGDGAGSDGTLSRLFGMFLTWMQEHAKPVFVIATANSVQNLPPEMLRKGRFDELFFINLPNYHERQAIFQVHLQKRTWNPEHFDLEQLSQRTEGYSGAEIEQVVIAAMFEAYTQGRPLQQADLLSAQEQTVPLSVTMEEKIFELREWARTRCRPATPDSRVIQMLEEESRQMR